MTKEEVEVVKVDAFKPDYGKRCVVCKTPHVVTGVRNGKVVYRGDMCGVCTWGESAMADPDLWNK